MWKPIVYLGALLSTVGHCESAEDGPARLLDPAVAKPVLQTIRSRKEDRPSITTLIQPHSNTAVHIASSLWRCLRCGADFGCQPIRTERPFDPTYPSRALTGFKGPCREPSPSLLRKGPSETVLIAIRVFPGAWNYTAHRSIVCRPAMCELERLHEAASGDLRRT